MRKTSSTNFENEQALLQYCSMTYTLNVVSGRWKATILWHLSLSPNRYKELLETIPDITHRMLSLSLNELVKDGLVIKTKTNSFPPQAVYSLTEKGQSLQSILTHLAEWGQVHNPVKE
jgi:DNA-binding HxlR family transcriptional regulator